MAESWHSTFQRMRRIGDVRDWMTWGEFDGLLRQCGISLTPYHVRRAVAVSPPEKAFGAKRYRDEHLRLAAAYAEARGLIPRKGRR